MSVLDVLGRAATVTGKGIEGYAIDERTRVKDAMAKEEAKRQAERDRTMALLAGRSYDPGRGAVVDRATGTAVAVSGLPPEAPPPPPQTVSAGEGVLNPKTGKYEVPVPAAAPTPPNLSFQTIAPEGQAPVIIGVDPKTGKKVSEVGLARPVGGTSTGSATMVKAKAANAAQMAVIRDALKELDAHPDAVGLLRGIPMIGDRLDPRADPAGVGARASIANIGSLKIHDRSGAAVSVHEFPRLAPFIPSISDPPDAIRTKLQKLLEGLQVETDALQGDAPGAPPAASGAPIDHTKLSDEEFARRWKAGEFRTP